MKRLLSRFLAVPLAFILTLSCSEEQDFNQFDDLTITPTVASSIFYLESTEELINAVPTFPVFYSQEFSFDPFNEQFVADHLLDGMLLYELENTTSKQLTLTIEFMDDANTVLDTETFTIEPEPAPLLTREVAYGPGGKNLDILTNTTRLRVSGQNLGDNTSVSPIADPTIIFRSAGEFRFRLQ